MSARSERYKTVASVRDDAYAEGLNHLLEGDAWRAKGEGALGTVAANMLLNGAAIPLWGPLGAAWVTVVTQTLWTVWVARIVLRQLSVGAAHPAELPHSESSQEAF